MPHAIVHYSKEFDNNQINSIVDVLHEAILATGTFPEGGLRVRTFLCDSLKIDEAQGASGFLHMEFKIGHGRSPDDLKKAGELIFDSLKAEVAGLNLAKQALLSLEFIELHETLNFKKNNLRSYMADRKKNN